MRRNTFILLWGLLFSILPPLLICAVVAIYHSAQYPNAFEQAGIMTEGRREMYHVLDGLRPAIGLTFVAGLVLGLTLGLSQKLPGTKVKAARMSKALKDLLRQTSRTFYKTLRILPSAVRPQISLAYLLARTTDTIADTELVPLEQRLQALQKLRERILGTTSAPLNFGELARRQTLPAEQTLLEKVEDSLALLKTLSPADLQLVRAVLDTITSGQELDLRRFADAIGARTPSSAGVATTIRADEGIRAPVIVALQTDAELDDYTYRVAGCVGEFWTKMCRAHLFANAKLGDAQLLADGVRFGKGLQLVNILRDLPADLRKGRCYPPSEKLAELGLSASDLLRPENEPKLRPLYNVWLDHAESHLAAGWAYTNALPFGQVRVRLACAWPILIGMKTIERLRSVNVLDANERVKITRPEVRGIIARSVLIYPFPPAWRKLFH